jgi:hypothetical protein
MDGFFARATRDELTSQQLTARLAETRNIPPHNPAAEQACDAFPLQLLADPSLLAALPWKELLAASVDMDKAASLTGKHPDYVLDRLDAVRDAESQEKAAKTAAYLSLLLRFAMTAPKRGSFPLSWLTDPPAAEGEAAAGGKAPRGGFGASARVAAHLQSRFTETEGAGSDQARCGRPQAMCDLLVSYILVLALHLSNYSLDYNAVAEALKTEAVKLVKHTNTMGCKIRRPPGQTPRAVLMPDCAAGQTLADFLPASYMRAKAASKYK